MRCASYVVCVMCLLTMVAQAEPIGRYVETKENSDQLIVVLDNERSSNSYCETLKDPKTLSAYLRWTAVTEQTTPYAEGCWDFSEDGYVDVRMWTRSLNELVTLYPHTRAIQWGRY